MAVYLLLAILCTMPARLMSCAFACTGYGKLEGTRWEDRQQKHAMKGRAEYVTDTELWDRCKRNREKYNRRKSAALSEGRGLGLGYYYCKHEGEDVRCAPVTGQLHKASAHSERWCARPPTPNHKSEE